MKTLNLKPIALHAGGWSIFIIYELSGVFYINGNFRGLGVTLAYYLISIAIFYTHSQAVLPFVLRKKRKAAWLILLVASEIICALAFKYVFDKYVIHHAMPSGSSAMRTYLFLGIWRDTWFLILATVFWALHRLFRYREAAAIAETQRLNALKEKAIIEKDAAELQFAFLQQQINPHFLFNTLNFVYSSVLKISPVTADAMGRLSEMIRYSFQSQAPTSVTPLSAELEQIENMIGLNRLRYDYKLYLEFKTGPTAATLTILPLVLLTFAENVFKHGDLTDPERPGTILVHVDSSRILTFETRNKKRRGSPARPGGRGIANVIMRLDHVYGKNYSIRLDDRDDEFALNLTISL